MLFLLTLSPSLCQCLACGSPHHRGSWESLAAYSSSTSSSYFLFSFFSCLWLLAYSFSSQALGATENSPCKTERVTRRDPEMIAPDEPRMCGVLTTVPYSRDEPGRQAGRHPGRCGVCGCTAEHAAAPASLGIMQGERCVCSTCCGAQWNGSHCRCIIDEIHCDVNPGGRSKAKQNDC